MATTMQLSDLMNFTRQRADMFPQGYTPSTNGNTQLFVQDAELISYINQSYFELYDLMISCYGNNYFVASPYSITTDGVNYLFALPTDFYKLLGVDLQLAPSSPTSNVTVRPFEFADRNRYAVPNFQTFYGVTNLRYRLNGSNIWLTPLPAGGQVLLIWYIPVLTTLSNLTDTVNGISGWTEYIIVDAALKCILKEESDTSALMAAKDGLIRRIQAMADARDAGAPPKVTDALNSDFWFSDGSGSGQGSGSY